MGIIPTKNLNCYTITTYEFKQLFETLVLLIFLCPRGLPRIKPGIALE